MGVALVGLLPDSMWAAGQVTAAGVYTADTADAQDADTNDFALETTTNGDGFLVSADVPFGVLSLDITTASVTGTPVRVLEYWNGAWTTLPATQVIVGPVTSAHWVAAETLILFESPVDWVVGGTGTNVPATRYNIRVRATTAPTGTAGLARRIYVGVVLLSRDALPQDNSYVVNPAKGFGVPGYLMGISGAFPTVDAGNGIQLIYMPSA